MEKEILKKKGRKFWQKWSIAFRILPLMLVIALLKCWAHYYDWEVMELNALFTSLVAGTIFLIGFLISGVLSDYKESEKIPSEIAASLKTLLDDSYTICKGKNSQTAAEFIEFQKSFTISLLEWFYKREKTKSILQKISDMNDYFIKLDNEGIQPGYIIKMKNEQNSLRKFILRVDTIRDTDFIGSAYAIVEAMAAFTAIGLIIMRIQPFYAALFLTLLVTFLISYMIFLIIDLDNPFDYSENGEGGTEVPLKPIRDYQLVITNFEIK